MINSKLRFAKKKDFDYFFGDDTPKYSAKAWVLVSGKDRLAIGGVWLMGRQFTSFVKIKKTIPKKEFWKVSKYVTNELLKMNLPIICFRDASIKNSDKYLEKLGYKYKETLNNQEIYKLWAQQQSL